MRTTSKFLAVALAAALQPAVADTVTVGFEVAGNTKASAYNSNGVTFSGDAWAVRSNSCSGGTSLPFSGQTGCGALLLTAEAAIEDPDATTPRELRINFAAGFVDDISFLFQLGKSYPSKPTIEIFSGLDGTGNSLLSLTALSGTPCDNGAQLFCGTWDRFSNDKNPLSAVAHSIVISGFDQTLMLDQLTLKTASTGSLPEPTSAGLVIGALGALGWSRRRTAR